MSEDQGTITGKMYGSQPGWQSPDPEACYSFNLFGVWIIDGKAYHGTDSGCSCPSPWEGVTSVDDLTQASVEGVIAAYLHHSSRYDGGDGYPEVIAALPKLALWLVSNGIA